MSKYDKIIFSALEANQTQQIGASLAASLMHPPTTILLSGDLGAGKTTFVQGLGLGLGLRETITSPTFALENRYGDVLLHMDLYRLDPKEARRLVEESSDFPGVRVVEWSEKLQDTNNEYESVGASGLKPLRQFSESSILIHITDPTPSSRTITITFADLPLPSRSQIETWRKEMRLPEHLGEHCDAVGAFAQQCARALIDNGTVARPLALQCAGELHDLLRFADFRPDVQSKIPHAQEADTGTQTHWDAIKKQYPGTHEEACAVFLAQQGYAELGDMIQPHGLATILEHPEEIKTTEQRILFYADKRVQYDRVVSLDERFDDFIHRYDNDVESAFNKETRKRTKELEKELFGNDVP